MALHGNPFLGKLKIPAPDLSHIPAVPFESKSLKSNEPNEAPTDIRNNKDSNRTQPASIGLSNRLQPASDIGLNRTQQVSKIDFNRLQDATEAGNGNLLKPNKNTSNRFQQVSESASDIGFKIPPIGELAVLRHLADKEISPGAAIPIRRRELASSTAQTIAGVKTALSRLSRAQLIELAEYKCGKVNGFTSYRLTARARTILASKEAINGLGFNRLQQVSESASIGFLSSSSSLVLENLKTTTTSDSEISKNDRVQLPPDWASVEITCVAPIGFTRHQLLQIIRDGQLTPQEVRDSLSYYTFDYERGRHKDKRDPLAYLMKILRTPSIYPRPENYESPLEASRRKRREELEQKEREYQAEQKRLMDLEYFEWRRGLGDMELAKLLPEYARKPGQLQNSALRAHFEERVWPECVRRVDIPLVETKE